MSTRTATTTESAAAPQDDERPAQARPHLLLVMECHRPHAPSVRLSLSEIDEVRLGRGRERAFDVRREAGVRVLDVRIADPWWSSSHARLRRVLRRWVLEDLGSKNGTSVNGARITTAEVHDGDVIEVGQVLFVWRHLVSEYKQTVFNPSSEPGPVPEWATLLPALAEEHGRLARLAASSVPILLRGETGTGKEVAARAVHRLSRRPGEFIGVNCGALPRDLVEAELFGHRRGAFSGATEDRPGLLRAADKGTLLLDEIGDLPPQAQAALLRVLQENEVRPVGSTRSIPVDIRVIAATHRPLQEMVHSGAFRADLLARLSGYTTELWPLRRRREDIGLLTSSLASRLAPERAAALRFEPRAARALLQHTWPANLRELEKTLASALVLAGDEPIALRHLSKAVQSSSDVASARREQEESARRERLVELLRACGGNVAEVARVMGKGRTQILRWMARHELDANSFRR